MALELLIDGLPTVTINLIDDAPKTRRELLKSLPLKSSVERWGDEIYFYVEFRAPLEPGARSRMKVGDVAYWPGGPALAIFFGPTPASEGREPTAVSECNVIGRINASPDALRRAKEGKDVILRQR
jgi:hypothetical protein